MATLSLWIVRITLGISFFLHGLGKFPYPPEKFASWLESIDVVAPMTVAILVAVGEMAAGIGVIVGGIIPGRIGDFLTRISALGIFIIMVGAFYLAHSDWFITTKLFSSVQIFLLVSGLFFFIKGNNK